MSEDINKKINWESFLHAVDSKRVVPIIGGAFYYTEDNNSLDDYVLEKLKERFNYLIEFYKALNPNHNDEKDVDFNVLSDLFEFYNKYKNGIGNATNIYNEIYSVLAAQRMKCKQEIVDFLSINKFPLILTTSYCEVLEDELKARYSNVSTVDYVKTAQSDIGTAPLPSNPTLCYVFGKVKNIAKKNFVVTEDDLLDYMQAWNNMDTRPINLCNYLKDKFLLLLGCEYPNWLFRFFWHSLRSFNVKFPDSMKDDFDVQGVVASKNIEADMELIKFLNRIQTEHCENSTSFIDEFMRRWNSYDAVSNDMDNDNVDFFISYAHEDREEAIKISDRLKKIGAEVWLDEKKLKWGEDFAKVIQKKIKKAKRFVPILSYTSSIRESGYYRREWKMAVDEYSNRFANGKQFIYPIVIDNSDVYSPGIPEEFKIQHIISSSDSSFEDDALSTIRDIRTLK